MEPCLFRHGKAPGSHAGPERDALLQWSHVFSDMVSDGTGDRAVPGARFNGAMSFQTW